MLRPGERRVRHAQTVELRTTEVCSGGVTVKIGVTHRSG
ncbi:hypothetical protein EBESD8_25600 [Rhodococcus aetherivorans]|nr:hypothetical protein EBESD8_25600 [Rhodococcus aetherivorans]